MKRTFHLLLKVIVQQFYLRNTGFFLFLFVVFFGVVQNPLSYHYQLMQDIVSSYTTLAVAMFFWLLYGSKCTIFILQAFAKKENTFLYQLQAMPFKQTLLLLSAVQTLLFLPIFVYTSITVCVGFYIHQPVAAVAIVLFLMIVHFTSIAVYYKNIFRSGKKIQLTKPVVFRYHFPKKFLFFLLYYHLYNGKLKTAAVKFISFVLLFIPLVWNGDHFEFSDFILFFQISIAAHAVIVYDGVLFLEKRFPALRNMPLSLYKIFLLFSITYIVLLLPEAFIVWHYSRIIYVTTSPFSLIIYYLAQLLLYTSLAYEKRMKIENYLLYIGLVTALSLLLSPLKALAAAGFSITAIAYIIFSSLYYAYEAEHLIQEK